MVTPPQQVELTSFREHGYRVYPGLLRERLPQLTRAIRDENWHRARVPWIDGQPIGDRSINSVHFPHLAEPSIAALASTSPIPQIVRRLVNAFLRAESSDPELIQSMFYKKPPGARGQSAHQDERFTPTRDASLVSVWIAIDDANEENGCIWVEPGSHRSLRLLNHDPKEASAETVKGESVESGFDRVPLELQAGDVAMFSGFLVHGSGPNNSSSTRRSLVLNYRRESGPQISGRACPSCLSVIDLGSDLPQALGVLLVR